MYPPQRAGVRATTIHDLVPLHHPGVDDQAHAVDARRASTANAARTCDVVFANSAFTADDFADDARRSRASGSLVAHPGIGAEFTADGEAADLGRPVRADGRDARAAQEPRHARRRVRAARGHRTRRSSSSAARAGASSRNSTGRASSGSAASTDDELARLYRGAAAVVYPSRFEGFGMPITEAMASGAPVVASAHPSMDEACGDAARAGRPREPRGDRGAASARRSAAATSCARKGSSTRARFSWRADRRDLPRGVRAIRVALDTTPLLQTRAGTARYVDAAARAPARAARGLVPGDLAAAHASPPTLLWYPRLAAPRGADVLHCPTFRGPFRVAGAARRHRARPRRAAAPRVVQPLDARRTRALAVPRVVRAASRVIAVSEFTKRELVGAARASTRAKIRVVPNAVEDVFTPDGPRAEGDYVLAVGTLEPRKNLPRIAQAVDGELRVVGARGWGDVDAAARTSRGSARS